MTYPASVAKRNFELVLMFPFVLLGKLAGTIFPLRTKHTIFLFFPSADIGGAVRVNADITHCIKDQKPLLIFSKKPKNNQFRHLFEMEGVRILDLHKYVDNKWFHFVNFFFRGVLAAWINKVENPVVFGGQSIFFYKIIPHLKKNSKRIELSHVNSWMNFSMAFIKYINLRIFSTPKIRRDFESQYRENNIPARYFERLIFIDNKVEIPPLQEISNQVLEVLYVGRGAPQKRVHLVAEIAKQLHERNQPVHFSFVGDVEKMIPVSGYEYCTFYGSVTNETALHNIYHRSDVLILTSQYEGLPIVVMEIMARGKIVLSTAVDGIPDYITHLENGLLITETAETKIVEQAITLLELLLSSPQLKKTIGHNSYNSALQHFSGEKFCTSYRQLLNGSS